MNGNRVRLLGAARLGPNGAFELYVRNAHGRAFCDSEPFREFVREYYDFLMSPETERDIGETKARKRRSQKGNAMVSFSFLGFEVVLIRGNGEFATFVFNLPFEGEVEFGDVDDEVFANLGDEFPDEEGADGG